MPEKGMSATEISPMGTQLAIGAFDTEALTDMHRALGARLRAHHVSQPFIDRYGEDAIQKGVVEYLRTASRGTEIREPRAFVVQAAFSRAIDELRREARRADGAALDAVLAVSGQAVPAAEETAMEHLDAARLRQAIESLPAEERQVLSLHYFEEVSDKRAGELLYMSERTFRRRLGRTLGKLARLLDAPAPEPGSHHGLEIGLAAWASIGGVRVAVHPHALDRLVAPLEALPHLPGRVIDRLRGTGTRLAGSDAPERIGAIGAGPAGKVLGGCAGAAIVCVLSGVVGPGVHLGGPPSPSPRNEASRAAIRAQSPDHSRPSRPPNPLPDHAPAEKAASTASTVSSPIPKRRASKPKVAKQKKVTAEAPTSSEAEVAEEQFSGIARATQSAESESVSSSVESTSTTESAPSNPTNSHPESTTASAEAHAAQEQFRGALGR
jgi:RNA polymerase sigma-70 factor (ECF subfamily)